MQTLAFALGPDRVAYARSGGGRSEKILIDGQPHAPAGMTIGPYVALAGAPGADASKWNGDLQWAAWHEEEAASNSSRAHCHGLGDLSDPDIVVLLALNGIKEAARYSLGPWDLRIVTRHELPPQTRLVVESTVRAAGIAATAATVPEGVAAWFGCARDYVDRADGRITVALLGDKELGLFTYADCNSPHPRRYDSVPSVSLSRAADCLRLAVGAEVQLELSDANWRQIGDVLVSLESGDRLSSVQLIGVRDRRPVVADFMSETLAECLAPLVGDLLRVLSAVIEQDSPNVLVLCGPIAHLAARGLRAADAIGSTDVRVRTECIETLLAQGGCEAEQSVATSDSWMRSLNTPYAIGLSDIEGGFLELISANSPMRASGAVDWRPAFKNQSEVSVAINKKDSRGISPLVELSFGPVPAHGSSDALRLHAKWDAGFLPEFRAELCGAAHDIPALRQVWHLDKGQRRVPLSTLRKFEFL